MLVCSPSGNAATGGPAVGDLPAQKATRDAVCCLRQEARSSPVFAVSLGESLLVYCSNPRDVTSFRTGRVKGRMQIAANGSGLSSSVVNGHQMLPMFSGLVASR